MTSMQGRLYVGIAFVLAGSSVVAARYVAGTVPPFTATFYSLFVAVATVGLLRGRKTLAVARRLPSWRWRVLAVQAVFGIFLFRIFLTHGLRLTSAAAAGLLTGTAPALTALLSLVLLRDRPSPWRLAGVGASLAGVMVLQGFPFHLFRGGHLHGDLLVLAATACEALFAVLSRKMHAGSGSGEELDPVTHAGLVSVLALVLCAGPMLLEGTGAVFLAFTVPLWLAFMWYGVVVTVVAFTFMFAGATSCDGFAIAALTGIIPLSAVVLSVTILGEHLAFHQWLGGAIILVSIYAIQRDAAS